MIQSMTGYGNAVCEYDNKKIVVEIKSLNSKQLDLSTRLSSLYREKDIEIRNDISQKLERGKVDFSLYVDNSVGDSVTKINVVAFQNYLQQITEIADKTGIEKPANWFDILFRFPDVMKTETQELQETEWIVIKNAIAQCLDNLITFRQQEGKAVESIFEKKIENIEKLLGQISLYEGERVEKIKQRLEQNLQAIDDKVTYDKNRLEQELIFYIEKLDVNEEKERLKNHLRYFIETMKTEKSAGKKLGFIAQEMGREINTLGSKANHSEMQRIVVLMKDELEQIKEQVLNVL